MDSPFRLLLLLLLVLIVASLVEGMFFLVRDGGRTDRSRVAKALTARLVLSFFLFVLLIGGFLLTHE